MSTQKMRQLDLNGHLNFWRNCLWKLIDKKATRNSYAHMNGNDKSYAKTNGNSKIHVIISAANNILGNDRSAAELEKLVRCESGAFCPVYPFHYIQLRKICKVLH